MDTTAVAVPEENGACDTDVCAEKPVFQKKIAYISDQQYPIEKADSEQVINTVSALAAEGVNIELVIPKRWKNLGLSIQSVKQELAEFYHIKNGFVLTELLHLPPSKIRLEKYSHGILAPIWAKYSRQEIIYTRNPLPAFVALSLGLKVIFETYRNYTTHNPLLAKLLGQCSKSANFLGIITHSKLSKESLQSLGIAEAEIGVIHNGFNPEMFCPALTKEEARRRSGLPKNDKIACYAGRLDREKGLETLIALAEKTREITYLFIGKTQKDSEDWIAKTAMQKRLKNIRCVPWMNIAKLTKCLLAADVLLIPPAAEPLMKYGKTVLPMKIFLYLAAGRPILAPVLADTGAVLNRKNAALVEPDNFAAAQKCIRRIFEDHAWANSLGKQAELDSKNYTWQNRAKKIIAFINKRLQSG